MAFDSYIYWKYPGEEVNRYLGADSYDLQQLAPKYGTELGKNYTVRGKAVCIKRTPPEQYDHLPVVFYPGQVINVYLIGEWLGGIYDWKLKVNGQNMDSDLTYIAQGSCNLYSCICLPRTIQAIVYSADGGSNVRCRANGISLSAPIIGVDTLHDIQPIYHSDAYRYCRNKVPDTCTFTVTKDGQIVYSRESPDCPEVWTEQPTCPPGTCEVKCGNHICCYNSLGVPILVIPN